jgi:ATP-dependent DNA helicase RecQ
LPLDLKRILYEYWGYSSFRSNQEQIIHSVINNTDTLAILATGAGKSLCYQLPALYLKGVCLVVTPLIALMEDQQQKLKKLGIPAVAIHSGLRFQDIDRLLDNAVMDKISILFVSPERLKTDIFIERFKRMNCSLIAVDEAHCISQWGHDFRPPYLAIHELRELKPKIPILALTASATPLVKTEIIKYLKFRKEHKIFKSGIFRPNLSYQLVQSEDKLSRLQYLVSNCKGNSIVYVRNRRLTKNISNFLEKAGVSTDFYHAGLSAKERKKKQAAWISGQVKNIVSTNAFGMGIDKADVRLVVHLDLPASLEEYYQEAGRAGRDGHPALAVLLYHRVDVIQAEEKLAMQFPKKEDIKKCYKHLAIHFGVAVGSLPLESFAFDIQKFSEKLNFKLIYILNCLKMIQQAGWIHITSALFSPSRLQIIADKNKLYQSGNLSSDESLLLKSALRLYEGLFHHPVKISEEKLAKFSSFPVTRLISLLHNLKAKEIIDYTERSELPKIQFVVPRASQASFSIDEKWTKELEKRAIYRQKKVYLYLDTKKCRQDFLENYFSGNSQQECGVCDICEKKKFLTSYNSEDWINGIKRKIETEQSSSDLKIFVYQWPFYQQKKVLEYLSKLENEKKIKIANGKIHWQKVQ